MAILAGGRYVRRRLAPEYTLRPDGDERTLTLFAAEPGSMGRQVMQGRSTRLHALDLDMGYPRSSKLGTGLSTRKAGRSRLLAHILLSRSLWWSSTGRRFSSLGLERHLELAWTASAQGWKPVLSVAGAPSAYVLGEFSEFYVDPSTMSGGKLTTNLPAEFVQRVMAQETFTDEQAQAFCREMRELFPHDSPPLPEHRAILLDQMEYPQARLTQAEGELEIEVGFCYGENVVWDFPSLAPMAEGMIEGQLYRVSRKIADERLRFLELEKAVAGEAVSPQMFHPRERSITVLWRQMKTLEALGWDVVATPALRFLPLQTLESGLIPDGDGYQVTCSADLLGKKLDLLPLIVRFLKNSLEGLEAIAAGEGYPDDCDIFLHTPEDTIRVPIPLIRHVLRHMAEVLLDGGAPGQGVSRYRAVDLIRQSPAWVAPEALQRQMEQFNAPPVQPIPAALKADLRPYQKEGVDWLRLWQHYGLNGILADEMGLGKTIQVIALLLGQANKGASLLVVPTSVIPNWQAELERFAPSLRVAVWHGPTRQAGALDGADVILTNYALIGAYPPELCRREYQYVILDEAQNIKNSRALAREALMTLSSQHRLCLTGTPIENNLGELWSLLDYLNPGLLGSETHFRQFYRRPIEDGNERRRQMLLRRVGPLIVRRTKKGVALPVPAKKTLLVPILMTPEERGLYNGIHAAVAQEVQKAIAEKGLRRAQIEIFAALLKLRQACCDSRLLKHKIAEHPASSKLGRLGHEVRGRIRDGHGVIIFSQFAKMLDLIGREFADVPFVRLDGSTADRATPVRRFQAGEVRLFLVSLKAGGTGLNLTAADTVILFDPWWNPAVEAQAIDRAHRMGQTREVMALRYVCADSIEERILVLQEKKRKIAASILDDAGGAKSAHLSLEDIAFLLKI
jgi:superfamily II DNA or RNA helicase